MEMTFIYGAARLLASGIYFLISGLCSSKKAHMPAFTSLKYYSLCMGIWDFLLGAYYVAPNVEIAAVFLSLVYVAVPFSSLFFFYFTYAYTFPDKIKNKKLLLLGIIPLITAIMAITSPWHNFFITFGGPESVYYNPYREITETYHFWFYIYSAYCYLLVIAGMVVLFLKLRNPMLQNKGECIFVIIIAAVYISTNFFATFINPHFSLWLSFIFKLMCIFSFYVALSSDESERIRFHGQETLIETFPFPIFFLNSSNRVIYANHKASELCPFAKNIFREEHFKDEIFNNFIHYPLEYTLKLKSNNMGSIGAVIQSRQTGDLYFLQNEEVKYGKKSRRNGNMLMLLSFETIESTFSNLEDKAFKDALCNDYNRHFLELKKVEFRQKKVIPIAFLMCDIDSLKKVNDQYGHDAGDQYIIACNNILKKSVRNTDYVFRFGGDEFLIIIPNANHIIAKKVSDTISEKVNSIPDFVQNKLGISVGFSVAEELPVIFDKYIKEADDQMYINKKNKKARNN